MTRIFRNYIASMLAALVVALLALYLTGWVLDHVQDGYHWRQGFFEYRVRTLDSTPAWFLASLILAAIHGAFLIRLSFLRASLDVPWRGPFSGAGGEYQAEIPVYLLKILGVDAITVVGLILLFIWVRSAGL